MLVCPFCGREFGAGVRQCPECRADLFFEATDGRQLDHAALTAVGQASGQEAAQLAQALSDRGILVRVRPPATDAEEADDCHTILVVPEEAVRARAFLAACGADPKAARGRRVFRRAAYAVLAAGLALAGALWALGLVVQPKPVEPRPIITAAPTIDDLLAQARRALDQGDAPLARAVLKEMPTDERADVGQLAAAADLYLEADLPDTAIALYLACLERDWSLVDVHARLANVYLWQGDYGKAVERFALVVAARPEDVAAQFGLARAAAELDQWDLAITHARVCVELAPQHLGALSLLGRLYLRQKRLTEAERCFAAVLNLKPDDVYARLNLGVVLRTQGRLSEAERQFLSAVEVDPRFEEALVSLGTLYREQGRLDEAIVRFEQVLDYWPHSVKAHYGLGMTFLAQGRWAAANHQFETVLTIEPEHAASLSGLGMSLWGQGLEDEAVAAFNRALAADPRSLRARQGLAYAYVARREYDAAEAEFRAAIAQDPEAAEAHRGLGLVLAARDKPEDAAAAFSTAARLAPGDPEPHYQLARLALKAGRPDQAIAQFIRTIELAPDHVGALNDLAWLYATSDEAAYRQPVDAIMLANRARRLAPARADILATLAEAYFANGDLDLAIDTVRDAIDQAPQEVQYRQALERYQRARGAPPFPSVP